MFPFSLRHSRITWSRVFRACRQLWVLFPISVLSGLTGNSQTSHRKLTANIQVRFPHRCERSPEFPNERASEHSRIPKYTSRQRSRIPKQARSHTIANSQKITIKAQVCPPNTRPNSQIDPKLIKEHTHTRIPQWPDRCQVKTFLFILACWLDNVMSECHTSIRRK